MQPASIRLDTGDAVRFFVCTLALSVPFWLLDLTRIELLPRLPLSALGVLAPMLAALAVVARRSAGLRLADALRFLLGPSRAGWLGLLAVAVPVACGLLAYGIASVVDPDLPAPRWSLSLVLLLLVFYLGALAEELGWTGLANRALARRWTPLAAGLLIGSFWAAWHWLPLIGVGRGWAWVAAWSLDTVFRRIIMCRLFALGLRSVPWMAAFHAMSNLAWQAFPVNGSHWNPLHSCMATGGMAVLFLLMPCAKHSPRGRG
ncbi:MAG: CPBP family glutamic-type intramembrane protease [Ottowia sp.]|uniref:CPBP family glutamic-type intramembrane protease n=1 Tax=Ottowia sp. TaxID=1898956 RepID=UPI0039E2BB97